MLTILAIPGKQKLSATVTTFKIQKARSLLHTTYGKQNPVNSSNILQHGTTWLYSTINKNILLRAPENLFFVEKVDPKIPAIDKCTKSERTNKWANEWTNEW